jgi:hypothetical protein
MNKLLADCIRFLIAHPLVSRIRFDAQTGLTDAIDPATGIAVLNSCRELVKARPEVAEIVCWVTQGEVSGVDYCNLTIKDKDGERIDGAWQEFRKGEETLTEAEISKIAESAE